MRARWIALAVVCTLFFASLAWAEPTPAPPASTPEEQAVLQELFALGRSLDETRAAVARANGQMAEVTRRQAEAAAERDRLEAQRRERLARFGRRLRFYQERGRVAPLAVLMGSSSFIDFLSRLQLLDQVLQRDAALMQELRSLKAAVAAQAEALRAAGAELEQLRAKLAADEAKLQQEIAQRETVLAGLKEKRESVEAQLAEVERGWKEKGEPLLLALGSTLAKVDPATFEPDQVSLSLFPPGATAIISGESLTRFFGQVEELKGLSFRLQKGSVSLEGQFAGMPVKVGGRFVIADKTTLRYEPKEIRIREFAVPPESISGLLQQNHIDIDVSGMISPWVLKSVDMGDDELKIKAGIK